MSGSFFNSLFIIFAYWPCEIWLKFCSCWLTKCTNAAAFYIIRFKSVGLMLADQSIFFVQLLIHQKRALVKANN